MKATGEIMSIFVITLKVTFNEGFTFSLNKMFSTYIRCLYKITHDELKQKLKDVEERVLCSC